MNATWVGTFTDGKSKKHAVLRFTDQEWEVIQYMIRVTCEAHERQGWLFEGYEMRGSVQDDQPTASD